MMGRGEPKGDQGPEKRWERGEVVVLRYVTRDGAPGMAWPATVAVDEPELLALWIPRGATYKNWGRDAEGRRALVDSHWRRDTLRLMFPGAQHSIWATWQADASGERAFYQYYVNLEEPYRRTPIGVDTNDHTLDIVVQPDLSWEWKDEGEYQERVATGIFGADFAAKGRAVMEGVVADIEARRPPFHGEWPHWAPDPEWGVPVLRPEWETLPATLWEGRFWAYAHLARG